MLEIYLAALGFGGTLLLASLVLGGHDADHGSGGHDGGDHDHDHGGDGHGHDAGAADAFAWLPVTSFRFWTFFLAFGGAVGAILTYLGSAGVVVVAAAAVIVGWIAGAAAVAGLRLLGKRSVDSMTSAGELAGATGVVLIEIQPGDIGKVRIEAKARQQDFLAETEDAVALAVGTRVLVVSAAAEGRVSVTRADEVGA